MRLQANDRGDPQVQIEDLGESLEAGRRWKPTDLNQWVEPFIERLHTLFEEDLREVIDEAAQTAADEHAVAEGTAVAEFDFQTRKRPLQLVKHFPAQGGFPSELHAVLGREDNSVYYSQSKISASPTARWQPCGARDLQQAYARLQLLVTPGESHPLDGLTVKLLPTASSTDQAGVDVLDGEILRGRGVARRLGLWTDGEQFYQPKQIRGNLPYSQNSLFQQFPGSLYPAGVHVKGMLGLSSQLADFELLVLKVPGPTSAALPLVATSGSLLWIVATVCGCYAMHRSLMDPEVPFPQISELAVGPDAAKLLYRVGFASSAALLASVVQLSTELLFLERQVGRLPAHQEQAEEDRPQDGNAETKDLTQKLEYLKGTLAMYDDVKYVLRLKDMAIERAYARLSGAEKDRAEQVYMKMIELLNKMEGQMYKILGTENPWFNAQVRMTRRWLLEQPGEAACGFVSIAAFVSGCLSMLCEFGVHPFYWAGLVKAPLSVAAMFGVGAVGGACLGALFVIALHYGLSTDCWVFLTDTSKSHVADINRMVQAMQQVEDDKFLDSLDEILKSMSGFSSAIPDVPDRLCQICLEEGHNVVAPVKAPRCKGSHFMCKQHWKRYIENFDDRCPQCRV
ncbi:unnamed protein product [Symbiodinium sp. KB8]|nr:unnamed protein product [Symbiodinium sp. KB8]